MKHALSREIKTLLLNGTRPSSIVVALRDLESYASLLQEVCTEYGILIEMEGTEPLTRNPAIALVLKALRLPEDDWPFAGVTALLRNNYFAPSWEECAGHPEIAQNAEILLRMLGESGGRDAYLASVARWAEMQQPGLEDEEAEARKREKTHKLAAKCHLFLKRFFASWDAAPELAPLEEHARWLSHWIADLGISAVATSQEHDQQAFERFWQEVDSWIARVQVGGRPTIDRKTFYRRLAALVADIGLPRTPCSPNAIRVLSAESARHLEAEHLFVMGLGERSFPVLSPAPGLIDDEDRQAFQAVGIHLPIAPDLLPQEMQLFYQLITRARRQLILSYPAVEERGQELLPSSFLLAVLDCFEPNKIQRIARKMLLEGCDTDSPLSPAEYRIRVAVCQKAGLNLPYTLPLNLAGNLCDAASLVKARLHDPDYNPFNGMFQDERLIAQVGQIFNFNKILSPTALEDYVACPYKFYLRHLLNLEEHRQPSEAIEVTRRGQSFHRALSRLHRHLKEDGIHTPDGDTSTRVTFELDLAIEEDRNRAPSPASKVLWGIEKERLHKPAALYADHWKAFLTKFGNLRPRPHEFEIDFGLPTEDGSEPHPPLIIRSADMEVRISGRIDRIDLAEMEDGSLGFWIIDYKTGRGGNYTTPDLASFRKLQLTLYALAAERVLLQGKKARPLGVAYWLVTEKVRRLCYLPGNQACG